MQLQVGVKVAIRNKEGKILLLHRNPKKYPEISKSFWDIVGGRIDSGVGLYENLQREIMEETGLMLVDEPTLLAAQDILRVPGRHIVRLTYETYLDGAVVLSEEHNEYQWFSQEELFSLEGLDMYVRELLEKGIIK